MWPYTFISKGLARAYSRNQTAVVNSTLATNSSRLVEEVMAVNKERNRTLNDTDIANTTASEHRSIRKEELLLFFLFVVSIIILALSILNLLLPNPLATLLRNARTTVMMNSRELERKDMPEPLDHLTRQDFSIDESLIESSYQQVFQWLFYLLLVSYTVRREGAEAATELTFWSLLPSSVLSIISLSLGQYKAHFLTADYSTSLTQKIVCLFACIGGHFWKDANKIKTHGTLMSVIHLGLVGIFWYERSQQIANYIAQQIL